MKIFIGLTEISGYYTNLKKGFEELGVQCTYVDLSRHPFKYGGGDVPNVLVKLVKYVAARDASTPRSSLIRKISWRGLREILRTLMFVWALVKYDVFIFGYNSSFLFFYDLPILSLLKKKIIYVFHGSDSRPPYINGYESRNLKVEDIIKLARKKKAQITRIERYADLVICTPLHSHLHERPIICFQLVGLPTRPDNSGYFNTQSLDKGRTRILHCPSRPEGKGTCVIRQAIKNLQGKGYPITYIEVIGKPHGEVLKELVLCDFVVDQLYGEGPIGGFAAEAAFFGRAAIVGTHTSDIWDIYSGEEIPPVHRCDNDEIEDSIEKLIVDKQYRIELGERAKQIVQTSWTPTKVAERYLRLIKGDIPESWIFEPKYLRYVHGAGLPVHHVKQLVRTVIEKGGKEALCLSDKPELERLFEEFAYSVTD